LDKLLLRLHKMYESISQATQSTIDHARIDEKIETVMGKLECEYSKRRSLLILSIPSHLKWYFNISRHL